jgi:hypothetical protein
MRQMKVANINLTEASIKILYASRAKDSGLAVYEIGILKPMVSS